LDLFSEAAVSFGGICSMDGEVQKQSAIAMPSRPGDETTKAIRLGFPIRNCAVTECRGTMARHLPFLALRAVASITDPCFPP
jgi:hypothetical protein